MKHLGLLIGAFGVCLLAMPSSIRAEPGVEEFDMTGPEEGVYIDRDSSTIGNGDGTGTTYPAGEEPGDDQEQGDR